MKTKSNPKSNPKKDVPPGRNTILWHPYLEHLAQMELCRRRAQELELRRLETQGIREEEALLQMQERMEEEMMEERTPRQNTNRIIYNIARRMFANPIYPSDSDSLGDYQEE
jgi:hypothetical protein